MIWVDTWLWFWVLLLASAECRCLVVVVLRWRLPNPHRPEPRSDAHDSRQWPAITLQIPAYREDRVLPRLLAAIDRLDYPRDRLSVQVLDDTEEPQAQRTRDALQPHQTAGRVRFEYLRRPDRRGFKAGNLNHGTTFATAPLIAILDADCVPEPGFLRALVPYFDDPSVGAVQARWGYLNDRKNPLTLAQGAILDTLFCFESELRKRRSESGFFLGTGGIWRRETIVGLGGWEERFTAEDFDLSYRARMAGWRIAYEDQCLLSCELPATYLAYKSQQRRWARSFVQLFRDHARQLPRQGKIGVLEATLLLREAAALVWVPLTITMAATSIADLRRTDAALAANATLTALCILSPTLLMLVLSQKLLHRDWWARARAITRAVPLLIGLSVALWGGVAEAFFGKRREWAKTLREGEVGTLKGSAARWRNSAIGVALGELLLGVLASVGLACAVAQGRWESWVLLALSSWAYLVSASTSWREITAMKQAPAS